MYRLSIIYIFMLACQERKEEPVESDVAGTISEEEEAESGEIGQSFSLPDLLQCSTSPFVRDFTAKPYVYRFEISNVYGEAATSFDLELLHPPEDSPSFIQRTMPVVTSPENCVGRSL